jgi:hypothetical protein
MLELTIDKNELNMTFLETSKNLIFDEYEIVHWIKHLKRFDFKKETFHKEVFFIGIATKLILNE